MRIKILIILICLVSVSSAIAQNIISNKNDTIKKMILLDFNQSAYEQNSTIQLKLKDPAILKNVELTVGNKKFKENSKIIFKANDFAKEDELSIPVNIIPKDGKRKFKGDIEFIIEPISNIEAAAITYKLNHKKVDFPTIPKVKIDIPRPLIERIAIYGGVLLFILLTTWFIFDRRRRFSRGRLQILNTEGFTATSKNILLTGKKAIDLPGNFVVAKKGTKNTPKFLKPKNAKKEPRVMVEVPERGGNGVLRKRLPNGQALQSLVGKKGLVNANGCIIRFEGEGKKIKARYNK